MASSPTTLSYLYTGPHGPNLPHSSRNQATAPDDSEVRYVRTYMHCVRVARKYLVLAGSESTPLGATQQAPAVEMERRSRWTDLPGFRFHPTEEELLDFYLKRAVDGKKRVSDVIGTLNLYHHDPSELPGLAKMGEREWYFLVPRDKNRTHGRRLSRTTERGFWKVTGSDRPVRRASDPGQLIGLKKTLVFYKGRAPHGSRTDWVMNEYRLPGDAITPSSSPKEDVVLCKVYRKATSLKQQEARAAMEECPTAAQHCVSPTATHTGKLRGLPLVATERKPGEKEGGEVTSVVLPGSTAAAEKRRSPLESGIVEASPCVGVEDWPQTDPFLPQPCSPWWDQWFPLAVPMPSTSRSRPHVQHNYDVNTHVW